MKILQKVIFVMVVLSLSIAQIAFAAAGDLDTTFNSNLGTGLNNYVRDIAIQSDGKIVLGGHFTTVNGSSYPRIVRLNSDGTIDSTFNPGTGFNNYVRHIELLSNGKFYVVGGFTSYNGTTTQRIVKLNSDGSLDTSFNIYPAYNIGAQISLGVQSDGKIIVGGESTGHSGTTIGYISRLNTDGTLDTTFNSGGAGFNARVLNLKILSDGKILVLGQFTTYNGLSYAGIVRLNSDGSIDTSFNPGTGFNAQAQDIDIQSDGKYVVAGYFTAYNGTTVNGIVRLNSDGSIDPTFNSGTGFSITQVEDVLIQPDGKIYVGGLFTSYNGTTANALIRLNSDGSIDNTFNTGTGFGGGVVLNPSMIFDADYNLVIGGTFTSYNGVSALRVARISTGYTASSPTPSTPTTPILSSESDSGISNSDRVTNDSTPTITGTASSSATISLFESDSLVATTTSNGSGEYSFTISPALSTNRVYSYAVTQTVSSQTSATSSALEITFDNTPATVSNISETVSTSTAVISWETNTSATSTFRYGISATSENSSNISTATTTHINNLTGLTAGTTYLYTITVTDSAGNSTTTPEYTFTTTAVSSDGNTTETTTVFRGPQGGGQVTPFLTTNNVIVPNLCEAYINEDIGPSKKNNVESVKKLQTFLNQTENEKLIVNGLYDTNTENAVRRFQTKYSSHILSPWGLTKSTGVVSRTTRAKINSMMCAQKFGCPYFSEYHKPGSKSSDIKKVKSFLNLINPNIQLNTQSDLYDTQMRSSVVLFQNRYKKTVLEPWGLTKATANWYQTTRRSAHEIMGCIER